MRRRRYRLGVAVFTVVSLWASPLVAQTHGTTTPGTVKRVNLEHVYNFDPAEHDWARGGYSGSDLEFFTHDVPIRDYATGELLDADGEVLPPFDADGRPTIPVLETRDFAVMGSYGRGAYVFDITDPAAPAFVTAVTCRQDRNDVAITKITVDGQTRVLLGLTQQFGEPCPDGGGDVDVRIDAPAELAGTLDGTHWGGSAPADGRTGLLAYAGTGCTPVQYLGADVAGRIALVDDGSGQAGTCTTYAYAQKALAAEAAGAIGLVQLTEAHRINENATAIHSGIPAVFVDRMAGAEVRDAVVAGEEVTATLLPPAGPSLPTYGSGAGGIGVFDITDPYVWRPMYRVLTGSSGAHNFAFHPTQPYGFVSPGSLPGIIDEIPMIDFSDPDRPELLTGRVPTDGGTHDVEFNTDGSRMYAAVENNYRIFDTTDAAHPVEISRTPNAGSYAHGVVPSPDGSIMVTNNESLVLGGFLLPGTGVCPGEGLSSYRIGGDDERAPAGPLGTYLPRVVGRSDSRPCTSHFGRFAPGTDVMSVGWYVAGVRIVDWSDPARPKEVASAVEWGSNTWAAKFHRGPYVYAGDMNRGFDVFRWSGPGDAPWEAS